MNGFELKINYEETIGVELDGVVSIIILYHEERSNVTVSGLRNGEGATKEKVVWLDQELKEEDNVRIKLSNKLLVKNAPKSIQAVDQKHQNEMKLKNYYALKKELEENNLI